MNDLSLLLETRDVLVRDWRIAPHEAKAEDLTWQILREELAARIQHLFKHDFNKLMTALYLLDIGEKRVAQAMEQPSAEDRAWDLAQAILERESQKIESRRKYAGTKADKALPQS